MVKLDRYGVGFDRRSIFTLKRWPAAKKMVRNTLRKALEATWADHMLKLSVVMCTIQVSGLLPIVMNIENTLSNKVEAFVYPYCLWG